MPEEPKEFTATQLRIVSYAGLFDGEGCIGMYRAKGAKTGQRWQYTITLRVGMTHRDTLARMCAVFGAGTIRTYKIREGRQRSWMWFCGAKLDVVRILKLIQSHLDVKAFEAKLALEYLTAGELTDEQQDRYYRAMRMPKCVGVSLRQSAGKLWYTASAIKPSLAPHSSLFCLNGRRRSAQQAFGADVFVDVWPMDAISAAGNFPISALLSGSMEQPWIPCERDRNPAPILQADA
jgi:hypothetical protein